MYMYMYMFFFLSVVLVAAPMSCVRPIELCTNEALGARVKAAIGTKARASNSNLRLDWHTPMVLSTSENAVQSVN